MVSGSSWILHHVCLCPRPGPRVTVVHDMCVYKVHGLEGEIHTHIQLYAIYSRCWSHVRYYKLS